MRAYIYSTCITVSVLPYGGLKGEEVNTVQVTKYDNVLMKHLTMIPASS